MTLGVALGPLLGTISVGCVLGSTLGLTLTVQMETAVVAPAMLKKMLRTQKIQTIVPGRSAAMYMALSVQALAPQNF